MPLGGLKRPVQAVYGDNRGAIIERGGTWALRPRDTVLFSNKHGKFKRKGFDGEGGLTGKGKAAVGGAVAVTGGAAYAKKKVKKNMSTSAFGVEHVSKGLPSAARITLKGAQSSRRFDPHRIGYKTDKQLAHLNGRVTAQAKAGNTAASDRTSFGRDESKRIKSTLRNYKPTGSFKRI